MCEACNGLGVDYAVDPGRIVPDPSLTLADGAVHLGRGKLGGGGGWDTELLTAICETHGIDAGVPFRDLPPAHREILLHGSDRQMQVSWNTQKMSGTWSTAWEGAVPLVMRRFRDAKSEDGQATYGKYMASRPCERCGGVRLHEIARHVKVGDRTLGELVSMPLRDLARVVDALGLTGNAAQVAGEVLLEVHSRLRFLVQVGLDYITLDRASHSLSGGESQRIRLASQIGTELTGVTYVLDEPSIGLHPRDNERLLDALLRLRDIGNTVVVVEHDLEMIRRADHLVDFGPGAGRHGGEIVAAGPPAALADDPLSLTGAYLSGRRRIEIPERRRRPKAFVRIVGASANNLDRVDLDVPLGLFCCVTGPSGAGKSTLVHQIVDPAVSGGLSGSEGIGRWEAIEGADAIDKVIRIDQRPIGRTPRSNPATYTKLMDMVRDVFASSVDARTYGYGRGRFSFNVKGGRCEACNGDGSVRVEMHFLPDVYVTCEQCHGRRFNEATLRVLYRGFSISDVLDMTVDDARELFARHRRIKRILDTLSDVGLGYVALGQPSPTLSGGEAQRIKLSRELARASTGRTLYILDEPSTGLHLEDVGKLLAVVSTLVDAGNSVLMIEHNLDIIKTADFVIDLGPEGGERGGRVMAAGTPEEVAATPASPTGTWLAAALREPECGASH
jgi:excinuclease ABC subunit A